MDKKTFNKLTKQIFTEYGFVKQKEKYMLFLDDVTIVVVFRSWRGVKSFNYFYYINAITSFLEEKSDSIIEIKMNHNLSLDGYHKHEILFEKYTESEYKELLSNMLHKYFDPYKANAIQFLKDNGKSMGMTEKAQKHLGLN